ncbi:MAG: hypothetical protein AB9880_11315 [Christensenellales bacterium]
MRIWQTLSAPFTRFLASLRRTSEQIYCGNTNNCEGLSFEKGNLKQDVPLHVPLQMDAPTPDDTPPASPD